VLAASLQLVCTLKYVPQRGTCAICFAPPIPRETPLQRLQVRVHNSGALCPLGNPANEEKVPSNFSFSHLSTWFFSADHHMGLTSHFQVCLSLVYCFHNQTVLAQTADPLSSVRAFTLESKGCICHLLITRSDHFHPHSLLQQLILVTARKQRHRGHRSYSGRQIGF